MFSARRATQLLAAALLPIRVRGVRIGPPATKLVFEPPSKEVARKYIVCGTKESLLSSAAKDLLPLGLAFPRWKYLVENANEGMGMDGSSSNWMFTAADGKPSTIVAALLPDACSRHASGDRRAGAQHIAFTWGTYPVIMSLSRQRIV